LQWGASLDLACAVDHGLPANCGFASAGPSIASVGALSLDHSRSRAIVGPFQARGSSVEKCLVAGAKRMSSRAKLQPGGTCPQLHPSRSALVSRRWLIGAGAAALFASGASLASQRAITARCRQIRERIGGRLGLYALDTHSGRSVAFDADARYAMASTFKLMLAAAVLAQADRGTELSRELPFSETIAGRGACLAACRLAARQAAIGKTAGELPNFFGHKSDKLLAEVASRGGRCRRSGPKRAFSAHPACALRAP
jgi:hypothetical protein